MSDITGTTITVGSLAVPSGLPGPASTVPGPPGGPPGPTGPQGPAGTIAVGTVTDSAPGSNATIVNSGTSTAAVLNFTLPRGPQGPVTVDVGTTTTGDPGTNASVVNSGTTDDLVLDFTIPRGDPFRIATGTVFPTPAVNGDLFWNTDEDIMYFYNNNAWVSMAIIDAGTY